MFESRQKRYQRQAQASGGTSKPRGVRKVSDRELFRIIREAPLGPPQLN